MEAERHTLQVLVKKTAPLVSIALVLLVSSSASALATKPLQTWGTDGRVEATVYLNGVVYIGGMFTHAIDPVTGEERVRHDLLAIDAATGALLPWAPDVECPANDTRITCTVPRVRAMSTNGTDIFVGGRFTAVDGVKDLMWVILHSDGGQVDTQGQRTNAEVTGMAFDGPVLYVGGTFTKFDGDPHDKKLSALDTSVSPPIPEPNYDPIVDDVVRGIAVLPNHDIVIGGQFTSVMGAPRAYIAGLTPDLRVTRWATFPSHELWDVTTDGTSVFAGRGGGLGGQLLAFDPSNGSKLWGIAGNGDVQAVCMFGGKIIAGGHFTAMHSISVKRLMSVSLSGLIDASWKPNPDSTKGVWSVAPGGSLLLVGGDFLDVGKTYQPHFA